MNDFERIKQAVDLQAIITQETGLQRRGHHLERCPFCGGHGCFSIKDTGFHCFQCEEGGDVFTFLESYHKLDRVSALKKAAEIAGITLQKSSKNNAGLDLTVREKIFLEAARHYHANLPRNGGQAYFVEQRGHREDVLKTLHVGWSTGDMVGFLRSLGYTDERILASGLGKERVIGGQSAVLDFFAKELAIFPHWGKGRVLHFTMKDPQKKLAYQLPNKARSKNWRFYNQDALARFNELLVVEGENDLLSVLDAQAPHVIGLIGQPADYQIKALRTYCASKHLYLWLDNDAGGQGYIRKICTELTGLNVRVVVYDERFKDPDEYLRAFAGDRRQEIKRLQAEAVDYVSWEILDIAKLPTLEDRLRALKDRRIFLAVADMMEAEQLVYVEKLIRLGFSQSAIEEQLESNQNLKQEVAAYLEAYKKEADPNQVAAIIYRHLGQAGRFFHDSMNDVYLLYKHHIYQIGNNRPFNALMKKMTGLLPTKEPGRSVWESLASEAYNSGMRIDLASWITTDRGSDSVFINLNLPGNKILKVSAAGIEEIPNGMNEDAVLLKSSKKILPINFLPDVSIREGMQALRELIFDNLTCEPEQRYLVICWLLSAFLLDFSPYMGLMKFSGASASGKTTAARLLSLLIYGNEHLGDPSTAAAYALAAQNPLLIIDNLESADITKSMLKFMLLSATKAGKEKRSHGTDSETIQEQPKALILITGIEPFLRAEHINRTYDIEFSPRFKSDSFIEDEAIRGLVKKRDLIISSILKFLSKDILPNLSQRRDYITILKKEHRNHAKNRTDEYLALLILTLEKILKYVPFSGPDDFPFGENADDVVIRRAWIEYQNNKARETETASNNILKLLDGLVRECLPKLQDQVPTYHKDYGVEDVFVYTHPDYLLEFVKTRAEVVIDEKDGEEYTRAYVDFIATSGDVVAALDRFCRNSGIKNPYETASVFSSRLRNDIPLLKKGGWEIVSQQRVEPYYRVLGGKRFWKFRKILIK